MSFVAFFLREQERVRRGGAERDSLLPLEDEEGRLEAVPSARQERR